MKQKHYHFIGIGGSGMSTLALLMVSQGHRISGSDVKKTPLTVQLEEKGVDVFVGHAQENIQGAHFIVYSSAIAHDNSELIEAQKQKIPTLKRAELLAQLMNNQTGITVAGAHGKTTTASMAAHLLISTGLNPTTAVGGIMNNTGGHASLGDGSYFVAEVDESDGSFLFFHPKYSIITNIDFEHIDYYQNWDNILKAYATFIDQTAKEGSLVVCGDDDKIIELMKQTQHSYITYGFSPENYIYADNINHIGFESTFDCYMKKEKIGSIELAVPGRHNILNSLACIGLCSLLAIDFKTIKKSLKAYKGVERRFQLKGQFNDITIVDDYGHHPTEIRNALETAQAMKTNRLITIFQPHRYSRTQILMDELAESLSLSDFVIVTDIYGADEKSIEGVSAQNLYEKIEKDYQCDAIYMGRENIAKELVGMIKPGDLILTLGAGDINKVGDDLIQELNQTRV